MASSSSSPEISVVRSTSSRSSSTDSFEESAFGPNEMPIVAPLSFTNTFLYTGDEYDGGMSPVAPQPRRWRSSPRQQGEEDDCVPSRA